jgi:23S rRNA pseudouridine1911/1915/1917 synthase
MNTGKDFNATVTRYPVDKESDIISFLQRKMNGKSRNSIKNLLMDKMVLVDDVATSAFTFTVKPGQIVSVRKESEQPRYAGLRVIFEDDHLIVIDKDAGLLSMSAGKEKEKTAYSIVSNHVKRKNPNNKIFIVHRIDRETSGLLLFAKSEDIQEIMQKNWGRMVTERRYLALVEGLVELDQDTITTWLYESKALVMYSGRENAGGQKAVTHYRVLSRGHEYSLLEIELETGRKNQIRVHMKDLGHSIAGDKKYGARSNPIKRMGLHAHILEFTHPVSGKVVRTEIPVPAVFKKAVSGLGRQK